MDVLSQQPILDRMKLFLDYAVRKQNLITSNLANLETPGYQAKKLEFEELFRAELEGPSLRTSDPRHFSRRPVLLRQPEVQEPATDAQGNDLNNVDLDWEMTELAQNILKFSVVSQLFQKKVRLLEYSIKEGRV